MNSGAQNLQGDPHEKYWYRVCVFVYLAPRVLNIIQHSGGAPPPTPARGIYVVCLDGSKK